MRSIFVMAMKDLMLIIRDRLGLFFIIGFPILMGIFFGSMYSWVGGVDSLKINIAVVDEDKSVISAKFLEALGETGNVDIEQLSREEAIDRVRRGEIVGMIAIPKEFGNSAGIMGLEGPAIEMGIDPSRKAETGMLEGLVMQAAGKIMMDRFQDPTTLRPMIRGARDQIAQASDMTDAIRSRLLVMMESLDTFFDSWQDVRAAEIEDDENESDLGTAFQLAQIQPIDVTYEPPEGSTEALVRQMRSQWDISFPQAMLWGVMACSATFAITIVRERKQGTLLRLQAAPVTRWQVLMGKAVACFVSVIAVIAVMVALGACVGMQPRSPFLLAVASICVAWCFVGIMMLMSVIGKTEEAVSGAAWGGNMIMAMFGGGMIPLAFMPSFMVAASQFSPVKWSILAVEGAIWRGFAVPEMILPCGLLLIIGTAFMCLGSIKFAKSMS